MGQLKTFVTTQSFMQVAIPRQHVYTILSLISKSGALMSSAPHSPALLTKTMLLLETVLFLLQGGNLRFSVIIAPKALYMSVQEINAPDLYTAHPIPCAYHCMLCRCTANMLQHAYYMLVLAPVRVVVI